MENGHPRRPRFPRLSRLLRLHRLPRIPKLPRLPRSFNRPWHFRRSWHSRGQVDLNVFTEETSNENPLASAFSFEEPVGQGLQSADVNDVDAQSGDSDFCQICRMKFYFGDPVWALSCLHCYHRACIERWFSDFLTCFVCEWPVDGHAEWTYGVPQQPENSSPRASSNRSMAARAPAAHYEHGNVYPSSQLHSEGRTWDGWNENVRGGGFRSASDASNSERQLRGSETCVICMDNFRDGDLLWVLPCCHRYHEACAERWLSEKETCPTCKQAADDHAEWTHEGSSVTVPW